MLALPGMAFCRDDVMPVTAIGNVGRSALPPTVARVYAIVDRTNNYRLAQTPLSTLRTDDPAQAFISGYPQRYALIGNAAVIRQPATTGLWVVSSAAGDTTQHAYVESILTGGYPQQPISGGTALNGTTRVAIGARTDHIEVTKFYVEAVGVGFISLYDAATLGNELARIPIGQTYSRYQAIEWWPIQTADMTEYVDYQRTVFDMANGTDESLLPVDLHPILAIGARVKEYELLEDDRGLLARADYEREKAALRSYVLNNPDRIASLRNDQRAHGSRLGASYPAGS